MSSKPFGQLDAVGRVGRAAVLSPDRRHRLLLTRTWKPDSPYVNFIGLNPSTADEFSDDPTIRRCSAFARRWGYGSMQMTNIFSLRATDPAVMFQTPDRNLTDNDEWLLDTARGAGLVVAAWGARGYFMQRGDVVREMLALADIEVQALSLTVQGQPGHPLYLKADSRPTLLEPPR